MRAKKYPQMTDWCPEEGIRLLRENVQFSSVGVSEFRVYSLNLDKIFSDLYTKYFPTLELSVRKKAEASWERMRTLLESLPKKRLNLAPMRLLALPQQVAEPHVCPPHYLEPFLNDDVPELLGDKYIQEPSDSEFSSDIRTDMVVAVYTRSKLNRPWLGVVLEGMDDGLSFQVQWYKKRGRSFNFDATKNEDGTRYTGVLESGTVMFWDFHDSRGEDWFTVSKECLGKIKEAYESHDLCYE